MTDFLQSVLDMGTIHPTIYSDLQVASDGSFMSTEEADGLTSLDFSGIGLDNHFLETDMDSAYAPFGASPSFAYGALDSEPSSMGGHLLGDWPIPPSSPGAANTAHEDLVTQIPSPPPIERSFGNDLSNIERSTADLPPLLSSSSSSSSGASTPEVATPTHLPSPISAPAPSLLSPSSLSSPSSPSSGVSTPKMATPTDLPSPVSAPAPTPSLSPSPSSSPSSGVLTPEVATPADMPSPISVPASPSSSPISAPTPSPSSPAPTPAHSSSSPARKSAKQRRNAAPSARPPNRASPSRPRIAPVVPAHHKVICSVEGCAEGFGDRTAMLRHVMSGHMKQRHKCHGCPKSFTRPDALVRHLNTTVLGSECRLAAMENGWEQVVGEKGIQMRRTERTDRIKIVADFLS